MLATAIKTDATIVMSQSQAFPDVEDPLVIQRVNRVNRWLSCPPSFASKIPLHEISLENIPCVVWGKLFSKDFLIQNNLRFIEGRVLHEDNGFWLKCLATQPSFSCINDIGTMYRIHKNSITGKMSFINDKEQVLLSYEDAILYIRNKIQANIFEKLVPHLFTLLKKRSGGIILFSRLLNQFIWGKCFKHRILSKLTFGDTRSRYKTKYQKLRPIRKALKKLGTNP